jgi:conjugative transfer pilus assembly protein TraH
MTRQNKYVVSVLVSTLLYTAHAGTMDDFLAAQISSSPAKSYRTENVIGYAGGDLRMRWGANTSLKLPISVQAPKLNVGCGGIDAELGGFAFLKDKLVAMFQNIAAAAPAFAFQLALKTLCSQCAATLQELQHIADQINSLSMNSCGLSSAMADWTYGKMQSEGMIEKTTDTEKEYMDSSVHKGLKMVSDFISQTQDFLNGKGIDGKAVVTRLQGSWLESSLAPGSTTSLETILGTDAIPMMRAMIGDVFGYVDSDQGITYNHIDPVWGPLEIKRFIGVESAANNTLPTIAITNAKQDTSMYQAPNIVQGEIQDFQGLKNIFKTHIQNVLSVLGTPGGTLSDTDIKFIAALPVPIYKILNNEIIAKGYGNADIDTLSDYIAAEQAIALLEMVVGSAQKKLASFKLEKAVWLNNGESKDDSPSPLDGGILQQNFFTALNQNVNNIRAAMHEARKTAAEEYIRSSEQKIKTRAIERQIKAALMKTNLFSNGVSLPY